MLRHNKILVVSDNAFLINQFNYLMKAFESVAVEYVFSYSSKNFFENNPLPVKMKPIRLKQEWAEVIRNYDLIFSLHCKQIFPDELVQKVKCINVHPGLNPFNRGWFPQVFSILNNKKAGATIHEIDEQLDHGAIIAQKEVEIQQWDTSLTAYNKIQLVEVELLKENLQKILEGNYKAWFPKEEGNINLKKDFNQLCEIDLQKNVTMAEAIDYLRAMTHGQYKNAFFVDKKTNKKIFVSINLNQE